LTGATDKPSYLPEYLVDLVVHERHFLDLNPNRKVATKGGSMSSPQKSPERRSDELIAG
jgi:hypothetical protein